MSIKEDVKQNHISYTKTTSQLKQKTLEFMKLKEVVQFETHTEELQTFLENLILYTNDLIHTMKKAQEYNNEKSWNPILKKISTISYEEILQYLINNVFEYSDAMKAVLKQQGAVYIE